MQAAQSHDRAGGPKRKKHYSYDENVDEPGKLIDKETTDIERETPADGNESLQQVDDKDRREPPAFEE